MLDIDILKMMEKFYISTNLPILALDYDGAVIGSYGYNNDFRNLFKKYNIAEKIMHSLKDSRENEWATIPIYKGTFFTVSFIDPKSTHSSFFVLGPHSCIKNNPMGIPYKPKCLMENLISLLYSFEEKPELKSHDLPTYSYHVKRALDYINSRYHEDISLLKVANHLNINKSYLCSIFKKETGMTITQKLNEVRIEKSKKLLLDCNSSLLDIALAVGFNNQNYFNIMFKKITSMTPMQFRNKSCKI